MIRIPNRRLAISIASMLAGCSLQTTSGTALHAMEATPEPHFSYYDVTPGDGSLAFAIDRASPIRQEGRIFHAYTRWVVEWRLHWQWDVLGECRMNSADVFFSGTMTLPRLTGGSVEATHRFDRYMAALQQHEMGHFRNGQAAAEEVNRALTALGSREDCDSLNRDANRVAKKIVEFYQQRDREYDEATGHGRTQGAIISS